MGRSPLMHASANGMRDLVERLLEMGAEVDLMDDAGETALTLAEEGPEGDDMMMALAGAARLRRDTRGDAGTMIEEIQLDTCDQYGIQGDLFARAILDDAEVPTPIEDAVANMRVIEAVFRSSESGRFETM